MSNVEEISDSHWDLFKPLMVNSSTQDYEFIRYDSDQGSLLTPNGADNKSTPFSIKIKDLNRYILLNKAALYVKYKIVTADASGTPFAADEQIALVNNALNLFSRIEHRMDNKLVETVDEPGLCTTVKNLVDYSPSYSKSSGPAQGWFPDVSSRRKGDALSIVTNPGSQILGFGAANSIPFVVDGSGNVKNDNAFYNSGFEQRFLNTKNSTSVEHMIPLDRILGVANVDIAWRGVSHQLTLSKNTEYTRILHSANGVVNARTVIEELALYVPDVEPSFLMASKLEEQLTSNLVAKYVFHNMRGYRSEPYLGGVNHNLTWRITTVTSRPIMIYIGAKYENQRVSQAESVAITTGPADNLGPDIEETVNGDTFTTLVSGLNTGSPTNGIESISLRVNNKIYPREPYDIDFVNNKYARAYMDFVNSGGMKFQDSEGTLVSYQDYKNLYPLFAFDVSKDDGLFSKVKSNDLEVRMRGSSANDFRLYAVVVSEIDLQLNAASGNLVVTV